MIKQKQLITNSFIMKKVTLLLFLLQFSFLFAQKEVIGRVVDEAGSPLPGVNVLEKGTSNGTSTDFDGIYKLKVNEGASLIFSYLGFLNLEKSTTNGAKIDVTLSSSGQELQEIQVVGSRNSKRTVVNSAVPIDIINVKDVTTQSGKLEINPLGVIKLFDF